MLQSATTLTVYNTTVPQEEITATIEQQCRMVLTNAREGDKSLVSVKMMFIWYDCGRSGSIYVASSCSIHPCVGVPNVCKVVKLLLVVEAKDMHMKYALGIFPLGRH